MLKRQAMKPNHTCKNLNCHKGDDGGPKRYYACNSCVKGKPAFWQEYCCSIDCYEEWVEQMKEVEQGKTLTREEPTKPIIEEKKEEKKEEAKSLPAHEVKLDEHKKEKKVEEPGESKGFRFPSFLH